MSTALAGVLAEQTTCPAGQAVAARYPDLHARLVNNAHLADSTWWTLHDTGDEQILTTLAEGPLTDAQRAALFANRRLSIVETVIRRHRLTDEQYAQVPERTSSRILVDALATSRHTPLDVWLQVRPAVTYGNALDGSSSRNDVPYEVDLDLTLLSAGRNFHRGMSIAQWFDAFLDRHQPLTAEILGRMATGNVTRSWSRLNGYAIKEHLGQSRHLAADAWQSYPTHYTRPGFTPVQPSGYLGVVAVYGNPNTDVDGVAWCRELLLPKFQKGKLGSGLTTQTFEKVHALREELARVGPVAPVTGSWDGPLPADQQATLDALRTEGLVHPKGHRWHPRRGPKPVTEPKVVSPASPDEVDKALDAVPYRARVLWSTEATAVVTARLDGVPEHWETFLSLMPDWSGTVRDLLDVATAL